MAEDHKKQLGAVGEDGRGETMGARPDDRFFARNGWISFRWFQYVLVVIFKTYV